ncbi:MAG: choice-of-anchor J domain-containing protein [Prevotella sp.]|nr:choice-of-anchor J domain-containing protein [Prevotella sp.]
MKKIFYSMLMLAMAAMTFTSCEDVPEPYTWPTPPESNVEEEVVTPQGSGTLEDPYNVAAAQALIQTLGADVQSEEIYVKGFISQIDDISPVPETTYGNATYWISDQKGSTAGQLEIYRGYSLGGEKFTSKDEIKEDDEVIVKGKVVNFRGSTPEFTTGSAIYSLNGKTAGEKPVEQTIGTLDEPITVAKAVELINALAEGGTTEQDAYIKGKITTIKTKDEDISKYKNIDYIISDGTNELTVFRGKNLNNTDFTEPGQINVGDEVTVIGKLTKFVDKNGKVIPEVAQGNYIVKITKGSGGGGTPSGKGSVSDPYSVPEALAAINALEDGGYSDTEVYVKGKVVKVTTNQANFEKYGNLNYLISENGEDANTVTVYSGDGLKGQKFSGIDALKQGDEVIVYGKLQKYVKDNKVTPEIAKGNYLYSLNGKTEPGGGSSTGQTSLEVNFKANGQGDWTLANVKALPEGLDHVWNYDSKYGMKASAYVNGTRYETDNWLVSPTLNLTNGATMTFKQALNFATSEYVKVMYTTTNGSGDVNSSEWKEASVDKWPEGNNWDFIDSKATLPAGTVRVAFRYTSTTSKAATWEIESVSIK